MIEIHEIRTSSAVEKSYLDSMDYVINPYVGCSMGCLYCSARFMRDFTGHQEPWGKFIDVKTNAPQTISAKSCKGKSIFLSPVTDAYLPLERKYKLTRAILEKLIPLQPNLWILTKSDLVLRDIDLLKQFENCRVGFTITTIDDKLRKELEPFTSSVVNKLEALQTLKEAGIGTFVFVGPILPFLTDWKHIVLETKEYSDAYMFENLKISNGIWNDVEKWLEKRHPDLLEGYKRVYFSKNDYWKNLEEQIKAFC